MGRGGEGQLGRRVGRGGRKEWGGKGVTTSYS